MAMIVVIQMTLVTLVMAQVPLIGNNTTDGWWFLSASARIPSPSQSTTPCLLSSQPVVRRDDYTYTEGIGGHKLHRRAATWNEGRLTCAEEGGHLAIINSIAEANAIVKICKTSESITGSTYPYYASIGIHDFYSEGHFVTIHGQSLEKAGFDRWHSGEPNNAGGAENCGTLSQEGQLMDFPCDIKMGFVCEIPMY